MVGRFASRAAIATLVWLLWAPGCGPGANPGAEDSGGGGPVDGGVDAPSSICIDGEKRCAGAALETCVGGQFQTTMTCNAPTVCHVELGCVECDPGKAYACDGSQQRVCNSDGTFGDVVRDCATAQVACTDGYCDDECGQAARNRSYIGCEYWPVDLDNAEQYQDAPQGGMNRCTAPAVYRPAMSVCAAFFFGVGGVCDFGNDCSELGGFFSCQTGEACALDAQHSPFAIVVSNPDPINPVDVTLTDAAGTTKTFNVAGGQVLAIYPQDQGFADQSVDHSGIWKKAYRLTSTRPIVAYQFNPLDNVDVFSNDASLLLPTHTLGTTYYGVSVPSLAPGRRGFLTVVATVPGTTRVTVTPTAGIKAGQNVAASGAGATQTYNLRQFEVLNLEAVKDGDLTGTVITSDRPVAVFAGHEASNKAPTGASQPCCADHLEDQLFPSATWGSRYAVARSQPRASEPDVLRIVAQRDGTTVTFTPAPTTGACPTLNKGQYCEVEIAQDTEVSANHPILVAHMLLAVGTFGGGNPVGDPSLAFSVPTEQFREDYALLVPDKYDTNYFLVVAPSDGTVMLDGTDVTSQLASFGSGAFKAGRIAVPAGPHKVACDKTCGIETVGYGPAVSYLFAGGLDLKVIVVE